jgi:predicted acetyltransferase
MSAATHPEQPRPQIELIPATPEHESILANLLELYIHDFSEFLSIELGADGRFGFPDLQLYWRDPNRYPFLVRIDGNLAGLVFVTRGPGIANNETVWDMAQFFVVRNYRRRGIGTRIAHEVWKRFPGQWEVRVMESNLPALQFWQRAVTEFTGEAITPVRYETDGEERFLFSFESAPLSAT